MKVLITGVDGFIGKNLANYLRRNAENQIQVLGFDIKNSDDDLTLFLREADFVFHLAGVNRPESDDEFKRDNVDLTGRICAQLLDEKRPLPFLLSSSIQAEQDNPYGISKHDAEEVVKAYSEQSGAYVSIYRLPNVFGKWCRPHYNSVVATFCHNIARDLPVTISDRNNPLNLVHIDDVVRAFVSELHLEDKTAITYRQIAPVHNIKLGQLADLLVSFRNSRRDLIVPQFDNPLAYKLYGTFLSYLDTDDFAYDLQQRRDPRGVLAEFVKQPSFGQIFVSRTEPGITRGNHYHDLKTEKFLVLEGEAVVRFRSILTDEIIEYPVSGRDFRVVDIPPGYTHSIENIGEGELVTLFWASEIFDSSAPDTYFTPVLQSNKAES